MAALKLEPPDTFVLSACQGWMELGNPGEAAAEWSRLSPAGRRHPLSLELHWHILAHLESWDEAAQAAETLVACAPESSTGWLHRAYALRRAREGGLEQAWAALHPAAELFPEQDTIAYNLACYATQLGRPDEGWEWFLRALQITGTARDLREMGLADQDLAPLWERIRALG